MKKSYIQTTSAFVIGAASGATAAYFLDPERGAHRRQLIVEGARSKSRRIGRLTRSAWNDLRHRVGAIPYLLRFRSDAETDELRLIERVRSKMGRYVSHPAAIQVGALAGVVTLSGPILRAEYETLLSVARNVPSVQAVKDQLIVHDSAEGIPALQGESSRPGERWEIFEDDWSPGLRFAVGAGSALLALYGLRAGGVSGGIATSTGAALLTRCAANRPLHRLPAEAAQKVKSKFNGGPAEKMKDEALGSLSM